MPTQRSLVAQLLLVLLSIFTSTTKGARLFAIGGLDGSTRNITKSVDVFDFGTSTWTGVAGLPTATDDLGAGTLDGLVFAVGGTTDGQTAAATTFVYDPKTGGWSVGPLLTTPRYAPGVVACAGRLYAVGGRHAKASLRTAEALGPATHMMWTSIADMLFAHERPAAVARGNDIFVLGGSSGTSVLKLGEVYDTTVGTWSQITSMSTARTGHAAAVVDGRVYAIGGHNGSAYLSSVEVYDPVSGGWSLVAEMSTPRAGCSAVAFDGRIYVVGGWSGGTDYPNTVETYDPKANAWTLLAARIPTARAGHAVALLSAAAPTRCWSSFIVFFLLVAFRLL